MRRQRRIWRFFGSAGTTFALTGGALTALTLTSSLAGASAESTFYVSPTGSGTACSTSSPCTLSTARSAVEALTPSMTGDLVVELEGGTYSLSSTFELTSADSGTNGYDVIYEGTPGQNVDISGATSITGWTLHNSSDNIWEASVPSGFDTRQLFVNGVRATLDSEPASTAFGTITQTSDGYTFTASAPDSWTNANDVDLVYSSAAQNANWAYSTCPISTISSGTITMQDPCYSNGTATEYDGVPTDFPGIAIPTSVENNYALLGQPGQFYLDTSANEIYYVPRPGEDISTATVVAPGIQTLFAADGTSTDPVENLELQGLTFEYATWVFGDDGELDVQADTLATTDADTSTEALPASVACHSCENVSFTGNTFEHLGGSGISFDGGGQDNTVEGNVVTDVSGNGIEIGDVDGVEPDLESDDIVDDNLVYNIANEYLGGVGIYAGWVANTTIDHNEVWDTPYTGISLGWGWGSPGADSTMVDNHIDDNYVHDVMTSSLLDGGAIYVNGTQGSSAASSIEGNYISQDSQNNGAIYLDNGSSYWQVEDNVIGGYTYAWAFIQTTYTPAAVDNTVEDNYTTSSATIGGGDYSANNTVTDNSTGLTSWPAGAQTTIGGAGLEPAYAGLPDGPEESNLAYDMPATASSTWSSAYLASNADDGNATSLFASDVPDSNASWQVDLGAAYDLTDVQILFRQDGYDHPTERENFEVLVSNSTSLTGGYTTACTQGPWPCPTKAATTALSPLVRGGTFLLSRPTARSSYLPRSASLAVRTQTWRSTKRPVHPRSTRTPFRPPTLSTAIPARCSRAR